MPPVSDVDAIILMATALASKRRPAALVEIVAAADLMQGSIPFAEKLGEAIQRLSSFGLLTEGKDGFTLTPMAQGIMANQPKKALADELVVGIKRSLADYSPREKFALVLLTMEQLGAAIQAYKISRKASGRNLLMPKPKLDRHFKVDGRWRRAPATSQGKP